MGTSNFAVPTLTALIYHCSHEIAGIFTASVKPRGRGLKLLSSKIHDIATKHNIPLFSPISLNNYDQIDLINNIKADVIVVVSYGLLIPKQILTSKNYGCLNIHPSDLPKYRGPAPIQHAIINGEKKTAVCIIQIDEGVDSGDVLQKEDIFLSDRVTFEELYNKCAVVGANMILKVLEKIDSLSKIKQIEEMSSYAYKLKKGDGLVNWNETAYKLDCKVRGMNPWPGVYFKYQDQILRILESDYENAINLAKPGTVITKDLRIACGKGVFIIKKLQQAGKAVLLTEEFLRGFSIPKGVRLS